MNSRVERDDFGNTYILKRADIVNTALKTIDTNKECFVAQWVLQNPDEKIEDWTMTYKSYVDSDLRYVTEVGMVRKYIYANNP